MKNEVFKILVGSHNYNLQNENSDKDWKLFVIPTLRQLVNHEPIHSSIISSKVDIETKSLLDLPDLLFKSNPSYLELLFSQEVSITNISAKGSFKLYEELIKLNEDIVKISLPRLFHSMKGMMNEKHKNMYKGTSSTKHLVEKLGYCPKNLHHFIRISHLLERYADTDFKDYARSLVYTGESREKMIKIKTGETKYTLNQVEKIIEIHNNKIKKFESKYSCNKINYELYKYLKDLVFNYLKNNIKLD